jgi:hypothetical protein
MRTIAKRLWCCLFGCLHEQMTWVFCDEGGFYRRCTECGRRFPYTGVQFVPIPTVRKRA